MSHHRFIHGCRRSAHDARDRVRAVPRVPDLPPSHDLRSQCPPVYDQGQVGSCTANALAAAVEFDFLAAQQADWMPSRLFIYFNERAMENTVATDAGATLRDGMKSLAQQGVCPERLWPYVAEELTVQPDAACYVAALRTLARQYERVPQVAEAMEQILFGGKPVVFAFTVYEGIEAPEVAQTGILALPGPDEQPLGGHAVLCVGYDRPSQRFLVRNSWGPAWGLGGYFWMPYAYVLDPKLAFDHWVLDTMTEG